MSRGHRGLRRRPVSFVCKSRDQRWRITIIWRGNFSKEAMAEVLLGLVVHIYCWRFVSARWCRVFPSRQFKTSWRHIIHILGTQPLITYRHTYIIQFRWHNPLLSPYRIRSTLPRVYPRNDRDIVDGKKEKSYLQTAMVSSISSKAWKHGENVLSKAIRSAAIPDNVCSARVTVNA